MKLQHTSGAVIEDARLVETERSFNFYDPTCTLMAIYLKSDWRRVPEERWEHVPFSVILARVNASLSFYTIGESSGYLPTLHEGERYSIIFGNLCVERRVEGA